MRTVYKYPVKVDDHFELELPRGAEILTVETQGEAVQLWALVDPAESTEPRQFRLAGTGHPIEDPNLKYVSSFQLYGGSLVFHVFEVIQSAA